MSSLLDLLGRGYFPRELPPPFQTGAFASAVVANRSALPPHFTSSTKAAKVLKHNLGRTGTLRRRLGIPNPISQVALCVVVENKWTDLDRHAQLSTLSRSTPVAVCGPGRALRPTCSHRDLLARRAQDRSTSRFILIADISRFYESIYTHSIPWALHTKVVAKAQQQNRHLLGNTLDSRVRSGNDHQTIGIPIGPDTSLVIAETILSAVDQSLSRGIPGVRGFRYVDDYELCFSQRSAAEHALASLQEILSDFELGLNPRKTGVFELPLGLEAAWASELGRFHFRTRPRAQAADIVAYFDRAFALTERYPDEHVLKYALARLRGVQIHQDHWPLVQHLLMQCLTLAPETIELVLEQVFTYLHRGYQLDVVALEGLLNEHITSCALVGHGNEVAWALWAAIAMRMKISSNAAQAVSVMHDSVVALLCLDARARGLLRSGLNPSTWQSYMDGPELYRDQWLLSYEANVKGWLASNSSADHVNADPNFGFLKRSGVQFYDPARTVPMIATGVAPSAGTAELFSLPPENSNTPPASGPE